MSSLILYVLEVSGVLVILYSLYWLLISKETFFSLNRFFLLAILALSFLFPWLSFDLSPSTVRVIDQPIGKLRDMRMSYYDAFEAWSHQGETNAYITASNSEHIAKEKAGKQPWLLTVVFTVYGIGLAAVVFRLGWSYRWIQRLKNRSQKEMIQGLTVVKVPHAIAPFSFLNSVFVHEAVMQSEDFNQILAHEKTHIRERHSLDLLFVQLAAAILWFNPVVWQLAKSLKTTHEYIADKKTIDQGYSLVTYQTLLLRQLISNNSYGLIHNFNLSFIKKRITMMNIEKSGWAGKAKVALVLSAVVVFSLVMAQCNSKNDEQVVPASEAAALQADSDINVPVLPASEYNFNLNPSTNQLNLTISENKITLNGEMVEIDEIASILEKISDEQDVVVTRIDADQPMALVREAHQEFRKANRLKFLYIGQTSDGEQIASPLLLPPAPTNASLAIDEAYVREHNMGLLKIDMGEDTGPAQQQKVYEFVKIQVADQKSDYVVSARFHDDDTYGEYLMSLQHIKEAFYQLYSERAPELYEKTFKEIWDNRSSSLQEYAEIYNALKREIPMAISIAED